MLRTSGALLHARLTALAAACWVVGCGGQAVAPSGDSHTGGSASGSGGGGADDQAPMRSGGSTSSGGAGVMMAGGSGPVGGTGAVVGTGGASEGGAPTNVICTEELRPSLVSGWHTKLAPDYVGLYRRTGVGTELNAPELVEASGTACGKASDPKACATTLAMFEPATSFDQSGQLTVKTYFLYTAGDAIGSIGTWDELVGILGPIDTTNEAAVVLWAKDRNILCSDITQVPGGYRARSSRLLSDCPTTYQGVEVDVAADASVTETDVGKPDVSDSCAGRRPPGLSLGQRSSVSGAGECLARIAELELASVAAFALLARELEAHGAPAELLDRCRSAGRDEVRHASSVTGLAARFGAVPAPVNVPVVAVRSLLALALDNAREGEVRELYGAATAAFQARHASDAEVRAAFAAIARDEAEHAALSVDIGAWLDSCLGDAERRLVVAERARAWVELEAETTLPAPAGARALLGLPNPAQARALLGGLDHVLCAA